MAKIDNISNDSEKKDGIQPGRAFASLLCAAALLSMTLGPATTAFAAQGSGEEGQGSGGEDGTNKAASAEGSSTTEKKLESVGSGSKTETVYAFLNADGSAKSISVSNALKNVGGVGYLMDSSTLENIANAKGSQEFTQNGEALMWDAQGEDIYYTGTTSEELPLKLKATYRLDGQEVSAEQLAGATGKVEIDYEFINESTSIEYVNGSPYRMYTPFMCASVFMFDNECVSNVSIDNGKIVDDGDRSVVVGYALPGMQENLGVSRSMLDIPSSFKVSFDAKDFSFEESYTLVSPNLMSDIDVSYGDLSSVSSALDQLQDATNQLVDGAAKIADGTNELREKTANMEESTSKLNDGMGQLSDNIPKMQEGAVQIADGTLTLQNSLELMRNGDAENTGMVDAVNSIGELTDTSKLTLQGGLNLIGGGLSTLKGTQSQDPSKCTGTYAMLAAAQGIAQATSSQNSEGLYVGAGTAIDGTMQVLSSASQLIDGAKAQIDAVTSGQAQQAAAAIVSGASQAKGAVELALQGASEASDAAKDAVSAIGSAKGDAGAAQSSIGSAVDSLDTAKSKSDSVSDALGKIDTTGMTKAQIDQINAAKSAQGEASVALSSASKSAGDAATSAADASSEIATAESSIGVAASKIQGTQTSLGTASDAIGALSAAALNLQGLAASTPTQALDAAQALLVGNGVGENPSAKNILDAAKTKLQGGLAQVNEYSSAIALGISGDGTAANPGALGAIAQLQEGVGTLHAALSLLRDGGTAPDGRSSGGLSGGVDALGDISNGKTLIGGSAKLHDGAVQLSDGLKQAGDGAAQLADGTQQLADAAPALVDGIAQLADGAGQLSDGLKQFNEEGIGKLVSFYEGNIAGLSGRLQAIKAAGDDYRSFSGFDSNGKSTVSFIFKTEAIKPAKAEAAE